MKNLVQLAPATRTLLAVVLAADVLLIGVHLAYSLPRCTFNPQLQIDVDGGYAELWEYAKEAAAGLLLVLVALRRRSRHVLAWALVFLFSLLDDGLQLHEAAGEWLGEWLGRFLPAGHHVLQSSSEVLVMGLFGIVLLGLVALTYRGEPDDLRRAGRRLLALFALLSFFGVLGDLIQGLTTHRIARHLLAVFEDGGEMPSMSIIVTYAWMLFRETSRPGALRGPAQ